MERAPVSLPQSSSSQSSSAAPTTCASCSNPTKRQCSVCEDSPRLSYSPPIIYYCRPFCEELQRQAHSNDCDIQVKRRTVYRICDILQDLFYAWRIMTFPRGFEKAVKQGKTLMLYDEVVTEDERIRRQRRSVLIVPIPEILYEDANEKFAILSFNAGYQALTFFHEIVEYLLLDQSGITENFTETQILHRLGDQKLVRMDKAGAIKKARPHVILTFRIKDTFERYALDLTGAQFGYHEPVAPWSEYMSKRAIKEEEVFLPKEFWHFGGCLEYFFTVIRRKERELGRQWEILNQATHFEICSRLLIIINHWDWGWKREEQHIRGMRSCDDREFWRLQKELLLAVKDRMHFIVGEVEREMADKWMGTVVSTPTPRSTSTSPEPDAEGAVKLKSKDIFL